MDYMQQVKTGIFKATNEVRQRFGQKQLLYSNVLDRMGQIHTNEMFTHRFFSHENTYTPIVRTLSDRIKYCGLDKRYRMFGENLADYPAEEGQLIFNPLTLIFNLQSGKSLIPPGSLCREIIKGWYDSPGHRANLLRPEYDSVGFGLLLYPKICSGVKVRYLLVTQNFGRSEN